MSAITCPHCGAFADFIEVARWEAVEQGSNRHFAAWKCQACSRPIVGFMNLVEGGPALWWPTEAKTKVFPDIPDPVAKDASEAYKCRSIGALRAAVTMARRAVQSMALDKGANPKKQLWEQIKELAENGTIQDTMREIADEIRFAGNAGAHPDLSQPDPLIDSLSEEKADAALELMDALLEYVYQLPAPPKDPSAAVWPVAVPQPLPRNHPSPRPDHRFVQKGWAREA